MWFRKGWYIGVSNDIEIIVNKRKIKVCHNITHTLLEYMQKGFFSKEAGGILIGKENKSNEKPKWPTQEELLAEIRDLLKKK